MNFSNAKYSQLKSRLKTKYKSQLKLVTRDLKQAPTKSISRWVTTHQEELQTYSPLHWLFLTQLKNFNFFQQQSPDLGKNDFGEQEDLVFEKWNASEFADQFLKRLNKGKTLGKASLETLNDFDKHLTLFAERQILKSNKEGAAYRPQSSLGEYKRGTKISRLLETTLHLGGKDLRLMTHSLKEMKSFSYRIETALKIIKKYSPTSWDRFVAFTEVIVPIKQKEFVSYSHQDLPGYSMINLYHRDFVDLMDDLLHENGHHHLNYYLNLGTLIEEPLDNIYYSPWRRTPRPLRGVFHAYFTFFWAFKLFADLARAKTLDETLYPFTPLEKEKIYWRVCEEFYMLNYTYQELKWAHKKGLIYPTGWELIQEQQKELNKFKKAIPLWEKKLKAHRKDLTDLKKTLKKAETLYSKN